MKMKLKSKNKFIPVNLPTIFKQEKIYVKKCLDTGSISSEGEYVKSLEFLHPVTKKEVFFEAKRPTDFDALIKNLEKVSI